ncbi:uncharacterized protein [Dysidea avara]|uniref:uncharacterized protein n=1 Tax=Dysidea avara TaxID=196820 RepID=UPI0033177716
MDDLIEDVDFEDDHQKPKLILALAKILLQCVTTSLWLMISVACLPLFLLGLLKWELPPTIPVWSRFCKYFTAVFTEGKPKDNVPFTNRVLLFLIFFDVLVKVPVNGVCWYIDELLYPSYHKANIDEPVFMITAPRTGSTQLCHYLEDDVDNFLVPTIAEGLFPYIWIWKLAVSVLQIKQERFGTMFGTELRKRHEFSWVRGDTWDGIARNWQFSVCNCYLGSAFMRWGYSYARLNEPIDEELLKSIMLFTKYVIKKVAYCRGKPKQHVLLKGHFLLIAKALEQQYPDAKFVTVVRNPANRLCSYVNLIKVTVNDSVYKMKYGLFPTTWRVIRDHVIPTQIAYCEQEMLFYKDPADNKLVIPFTMYVNNLSATLQRIYSFCNIPIPDDVVSNAIRIQSTTHNRTEHQASYDPNFNKSLRSLGVKENKLQQHLGEYIEWINNLED